MTDDKFILMGLNDDKTGHIAEVLKSKTSKKILDFLGDIREASEKDISDRLNMPINTVEYNLKKLLKSRLVDKTKNFFWSVKGKKIPMYKLARKHIIISPNKRPSLNYIKSILPVFIAALVLVAIVGLVMLNEQEIDEESEFQLKQFSSQAELNEFIKESTESSGIFGGIFGGREVVMMESMDGSSAVTVSASGVSESKTSADGFSTTNIQVEGVDEADIVKNDGKYIYVVSGSKVVIVDAYPAENMEILSEIEFEKNVNEIFINDDKLVVFLGYYGRDSSVVQIYDVSDKENPELKDEIEQDGNYIDSRMIGDYVYMISTKYVNSVNPDLPVYSVNGAMEEVAARDIYYWPYQDTNYVFTLISAIDINDGEFNNKVYLTGASRNLFVSKDNIYLTYQKTLNYEEYVEDIVKEVYFPLIPKKYDNKIQEVLDSDNEDWEKLEEIEELTREYYNTLEPAELSEFAEELSEKLEEFQINIQKKIEKTIVHKINIDKMDIEYSGEGEVPGQVLNQFSMDEHEGYFRIATTTGNWRDTSLNHLYVLNEDLELVGKIEDLAKGERIYSVRFMGDRAYIVTFRQIDPFYVIDLSNPENPSVLGYLKIPGYSSYLHPYDENHVIGLGMEDRKVKLSLFDVSDVENPIEIDKYTVEQDWSSSEALNEHKAFLFDREKELLVIPISYSEKTVVAVDYVDSPGRDIVTYRYWQGAYVFNLNLENGFNLDGKISHKQSSTHDWLYNVRRSLYMGDTLYTISNKMVKANDLDSVDEINFVEWENQDDGPVYSTHGVEILE